MFQGVQLTLLSELVYEWNRCNDTTANGNEATLKGEQSKELQGAESIGKIVLFCINLELPCTYLADIPLLTGLRQAHNTIIRLYWT